jgi:hypothetical protein
MPFLPETKIGHWYFVVICPGCQRRDAISAAPSPAQKRIAIFPGYAANCDCGVSTVHHSENIERRQARGFSEVGSNMACRFGPKT